jgi:NitT/TauT family transport system permease protein
MTDQVPLAEPTPLSERSAERASSTRRRHADWLIPTISLICCLLLWQAAVKIFNVSVYLVPAPTAILANIRDNYVMLLAATVNSVTAIVIGFVLAVVIGIPAATLMIYSTFFRRAVYPVLLTAQVLPKVALAPLFIVWFGFGLMPKVLMTFLISFFPIVIDSVIGLNAVRPESLMLVRSMGGSRWQAFWKIRLPGALPNIFGGAKVAVTFAVVGTIVAEFVGSDQGLGYVLVLARGNLDTVTVFAVIIWLIAVGFIFFFAVEWLERLCLRGRSNNRSQELGAGL